MNYIPIALLAYILNAVAVTIDKFLITKKIPDPLIYVFYFSLISLVFLPFLPFVKMPNSLVLALSASYIFLWVTGAYFMLKGLKIGQVARVIPIIGTLIPVFLLIEATAANSINSSQVAAVILLILGLILLTIFDWRGKMTKKEIIFEVLSALFFALAYILLRKAYLISNFMSVFVYSHISLVPLAGILFLLPKTRKILFPKKTQSGEVPYWKTFFKSKASLFFGIGQISAGVSELLLTFAISLATPALVNSLAGTQYIFLFAMNLGLSKVSPAVFSETFTFKILLAKIFGIIVIGVGLYLLAFGSSN